MSFSPPKLVKIVQNGGNQRELGFGNQTLLHLPLWIQAGQLFWEANMHINSLNNAPSL